LPAAQAAHGHTPGTHWRLCLHERQLGNNVDLVKTGTSRHVTIIYCFDRAGTGTQRTHFVDNHALCTGSLQVTWQEENLKIDLEPGRCDDGEPDFPGREIVRCRPARNDEAICSLDGEGYKDVPFTKSNQEP
jgi:hypothetical protein